MTNKYTTQDERSRFDIVNKIDTNLFIEAGAGSGKTTMLVNRMVAMVEAGIPVDKICAITFTKNAALEFYDRFQAKLIERANPNNDEEAKRAGDLNKPTEETISRCRKALENIDLCFMGTIDAFCNMVLSEHPAEANIPSDTKLINDEEAKQIYKQFFIDARRGKYGKEIKEYSNRFSMLFWKAEDNFALLMSEIMDRRNANFVIDENLCIDFFACFNKVREDTKRVLDVFNKDLSKLSLKLSSSDTREELDVYDAANEVLQKGWHYNYTGVQKAIRDISSLIYEASPEELGFTNESIVIKVANHTELNVKMEDVEDALLYKLNNYKYQNSLKLCLLCVKPIEELMRQEGKFTYFDYLYYLRNMLVADSNKQGKLIEHIYKHHSYFLIDEFQDTNPLQAELFFYLAAKDPCNKSWSDCCPKDGSLFIVGDPKQSIYRFRSADITSYLGVKAIFEKNGNCEVKYLVNNFRSKNVVKQFFNDVFEEVMNEPTKDQSEYLDIGNLNSPEVDEDNELKGIYYYESYSESLLKDNEDMADPIRLANIVSSLVENKNALIVDKDGNKKTINYDDFMIIFSGKKPIGPCIKEFNNKGIPLKVEGKILFEECEALTTIANIYKAVIDRNNVISLVESLYSAYFAINDNDLAAYRSKGSSIRLIDKDYDDSKLGKALSKLNDLARSINELSPSSLFEKIIDDFEIFKYVSSDGLEIVYYVLELIREKESSKEIITYEDAALYLNKLLSGDSDLERCLSLTKKENAVHIANLHKVKGLEAPIVILAKAGSANNNPSIRVEYNEDGLTNAYVVSMAEKNDNISIPVKLIETNSLKNKEEAEKESLKKENDRLVYVAATRARNVLIVNTSKQRGPRDTIRTSPNKWKVLKEKAKENIFDRVALKPAVKKINDDSNKLCAEDLYKCDKLTTIENKETYSYLKPSDNLSGSRINENVYEELSNTDDTLATIMGTMVHRLLEIIVMSKDAISKEVVVNNILEEYLSQEFKEHRNDFKQKLQNVYDKLHNGGYSQRNSVPQDILSIIKNSDNAYSEIPFAYLKDNKLINGVIDLIIEKDGELFIYDWKTNKNDEDLDEHYKGQLNVYKEAVYNLLNREVKSASIYHIDLNK